MPAPMPIVSARVAHPEMPTTAANRPTAMLDLINTERHEHILTIEDPIEFLHPHKGCIVNQREIGSDAQSFALGLKAALR